MDHTSYFYDSQYQNEDFIEINQNYDDLQNKKENLYVDQNKTDGDALLISLVHNYPYLYNKELTDFKDVIKKQNAWKEIGNTLNMTADECQTRWIRLRERYTREKKHRQEETTTGSGAVKRKSFEYFEDMQFLERFIKRRKTVSNVHRKRASLSTTCFNLQKSFGSHSNKESSSSIIGSTSIPQSLRDSSEERESETNTLKRSSIYGNFGLRNRESSSSIIGSTSIPQFLSDSSEEKELETNILKRSSNYGNFCSRSRENSSSIIGSTSIPQSSKDSSEERESERNILKRSNYRNFGSCNEENLKDSSEKKDSERNIFQIDLTNEKRTNKSSTPILIRQTLENNTNLNKDSSSSNVSLNTTSLSELRASDDALKKKNNTVQRKVKEKSTDMIENAICKMLSLLENKYSSTSSSTLQSETTENMAFCQLILSLLNTMSLQKNMEKKKEILRIIYDI